MSIKNNLVENHTYLIRYVSSSGSLSSVTILLVTEKAYHICWNNGLNSTNTWELISKINCEYDVIEDITNKINDIDSQKLPPYKIDGNVLQRINKLSQYLDNAPICSKCNGEGFVPDINSTSGQKVCPFCYGSKVKML